MPYALLTAAAALSIASGASAAKPETDPGQGPKADPPGHVQTPPQTPAADGVGNEVVPGQVKKDDPEAFVPPGQAKKDDPAAVPPGQAKKLPADLLAPPLDAAAIGEPEFVDTAHTSLGETVGVAPTGGTVRVKAPGGEWQTLTAGQPVPVGTVVDATQGNLEIGAEGVGGVEQHAIMGGAEFLVEQDPANQGATDLSLRGGDFTGCKATKASRTTARAAAKRRSNADVRRGLWASGKGRFRTHGKNATATVRGTHWITVDRCHSTTVRVVEGVVDVSDDATGKHYTVRAGERRVVRTRG